MYTMHTDQTRTTDIFITSGKYVGVYWHHTKTLFCELWWNTQLTAINCILALLCCRYSLCLSGSHTTEALLLCLSGMRMGGWSQTKYLFFKGLTTLDSENRLPYCYWGQAGGGHWIGSLWFVSFWEALVVQPFRKGLFSHSMWLDRHAHLYSWVSVVQVSQDVFYDS